MGVKFRTVLADAQGVDPFQQWLEIDLVVFVTRGYGEGEGHLRLGAACGVYPVSEDESSLASAYSGFGVALAGAVVQGSLAVGVYVGAVDGDDFSFNRPSVHQPTEQVVEYLLVRVLSELVSEVGEEAVAGGVLHEAACPGCSSVVFEAEGESAVAGDS